MRKFGKPANAKGSAVVTGSSKGRDREEKGKEIRVGVKAPSIIEKIS